MKAQIIPYIYTSNTQNYYNKKVLFHYNPDSISFEASDSQPRNINGQRVINKLFKRSLCKCNFEKLEGAQKGLKSFEGLSMKQIAIALTDLHAINMISGCTRHCLHCYANAQPIIKRGNYEDLLQLCNDIKELENRTGAKPCKHHGQGYTNLSFDADGLDCHLFDQNGKKYDYIDIAKLLYNSTGYKPVFDTNGWDTQEKQKIAEEYVQKLLIDENFKNFCQINISINPFNPKYIKAIKSGYPVEKLYAPFKKVIVDDELIDNTSEDLKKAQKLYTNYIKNTANVLMTFKPLIKTNNLGLIIRVLDNDITNMQGFRIEDFSKTLSHIYQELSLNYMCGELTEDELKYFEDKLSTVENRIFTSGRMETFYKVTNNGKLDGIEKIDSEREASKERLKKIKTTKELSSGNLRYLKMISQDGKVYLYDNYAIIPTDIQLKISNNNVDKPFQIPIEDFKLTEDMFDFI